MFSFRDERLGWTGDIQVFAATATLLYDTAALLNSWLIDLAAEQEPNGNVPFVIPSILPSSFTAAGWGAAATVVPMTLGERYGDLELLRRQYPSMKAWVEHVKGICDERRVWGDGFQFGDWVDPKSPPDAPGRIPRGACSGASPRDAGVSPLLQQPHRRYGRGHG
ncbi:MAG: hypothetical protein OXP69_22085 [Spirochaetaceae bacterium]|nr:hypothetical protein [Spirochaetaceae bacterium]